jgi:hypothetical protein
VPKINLLMLIAFVFIGLSKSQAQNTILEEHTIPVYEVLSNRTTYLVTGDRSASSGNPSGAVISGDMVINNTKEWVENWVSPKDSLYWRIKCQKPGKYALSLIYRCTQDPGAEISVAIDGESYPIQVKKFKGMYDMYNHNWDIHETEQIFNLSKGETKLIVKAKDISDKKTLHLFAIGLTPLSAIKSIKKEEKRALKARANPEWFQNAGYGLMVHWFPECAPRTGPLKPYKQAVNDFDVEWFANRVQSSGAKYLILNLAGQSFPAPIQSWGKHHPNGTITQRDLIKELAEALHLRDVKFILAQGLPETGRFFQVGYKEHVKNFIEIFTEIGQRYGKLIDGLFFDGGRELIPYPIDWEGMYKAGQVGNKDRIVSYNFCVLPITTPWIDYFTGEGCNNQFAPITDQFIPYGTGKGLQNHAMFPIDDGQRWWNKTLNYEMKGPSFETEKLITFIKGSKKNRVPITLNVNVYQDGSWNDETLEQLKEIKKAVNQF